MRCVMDLRIIRKPDTWLVLFLVGRTLFRDENAAFALRWAARHCYIHNRRLLVYSLKAARGNNASRPNSNFARRLEYCFVNLSLITHFRP